MDSITLYRLIEKHFPDTDLCKMVAFAKDLDSIISSELSGQGILTGDDAEEFHKNLKISEQQTISSGELIKMENNYRLLKKMEQKGLGVNDEQIEAHYNKMWEQKPIGTVTYFGFVSGAKWMRDKLLK